MGKEAVMPMEALSGDGAVIEHRRIRPGLHGPFLAFPKPCADQQTARSTKSCIQNGIVLTGSWLRYRGVAQPGSASALGAESRGFKSLRPDSKKSTGYGESCNPFFVCSCGSSCGFLKIALFPAGFQAWKRAFSFSGKGLYNMEGVGRCWATWGKPKRRVKLPGSAARTESDGVPLNEAMRSGDMFAYRGLSMRYSMRSCIELRIERGLCATLCEVMKKCA